MACDVTQLILYGKATQEGMKLDGIHRVLEFKQEAWLKPYIDYNTKERQAAKTEFKKAFHKLLVNACFGKTMENVRKRVNIVLLNNKQSHIYQTSKPGFKHFAILDPDLLGVELIKPVVILDKPIYVGPAVLDISKLTMQKFWYGTIKE